MVLLSVRSLYRAGSFTAAARKLARYKLDLVGVQEVRWDREGTVRAGDYNFLYGKECAIRRVQVIQDGLKLNGTHQLLVYASYVSILGGSIHTIKKNAEALVVASKETGLEVNADKTYNRSLICSLARLFNSAPRS